MTSHTSSTGCALGRLRASRPSPICVCLEFCVLNLCGASSMCILTGFVRYALYVYKRARKHTTFIPNSVLMRPGMMHDTCTFPCSPALFAWMWMFVFVHAAACRSIVRLDSSRRWPKSLFFLLTYLEADGGGDGVERVLAGLFGDLLLIEPVHRLHKPHPPSICPLLFQPLHISR